MVFRLCCGSFHRLSVSHGGGYEGGAWACHGPLFLVCVARGGVVVGSGAGDRGGGGNGRGCIDGEWGRLARKRGGC